MTSGPAKAAGPALRRAPSTLVEVLRGRADAQADERAYTFLVDGENEGPSWTWAQLDRAARAIAGRLQQTAAAGDRALLLFPPGLDFIAAFFGCLYAGVLAVPAYPPRRRRPLDRLRPLLANARPRLALTTGAELARLRRRLAAARGVEVLATDVLAGGSEGAWREPRLAGDDIAFLQFTSGSTAEPRGVEVRHDNLMHNQEMMRRAFTSGGKTRVVGWLPLYHDMGLIGNVLQPLYRGAPCVLMAPLAFLQRPARWLRAISRYRATVSGGPNFAYELCVRRIGAGERQALELDSWAVAFNGAEPVRAETLDRFAEAFAPCGFRRASFYPCYGLAEATLFVSGGASAAEPEVLEVETPALERDRIVPRRSEAHGRRLVGCGHRWLDQEIVIVDRSGRPVGDGHVGEIWVAGASVASGYWRRPEDSSRVFGGRIPGSPRSFLRTGDLGFLRGGELFVTGRLKDLIILRGRNYYPQDFEATAEGCHPALRPGASAAFAVEAEGEEGLVLVAELGRHGLDRALEALAVVRRAIHDAHEVRPREIVFVAPGGLARTSSGKVRRGACRAAYLRGILPAVARSGLGEAPAAAAELPRLDRDALLAAPEAHRGPLLLSYLGQRAARAAGLDAAQFEPGASLASRGLDSLAAAGLKEDLDRGLGVAVPIASLLGGGSLRELAAEVQELLAADRAGESAETRVPEPLAGRPGDHPLSHGQRALWLAARLARPEAAYHLAVALQVEALDALALAAALRDLSTRHPALRTTFPAPGGEPVARLHERLPPAISIRAPAGRPTPEQLADEARLAFDLARGPLLRAAIFRHRGRGAAVVFTLHHLIADLWSLAILQRELGALYRQHCSGPAARLEPVGLATGDVARWESRRFADGSPEATRLGDWWLREIGGAPPVLELPVDRPRPKVRTHRGVRRRLALPPALGGELEALARRRGANLYMALLAVFQLLLHRYSAQDTVLVGSPTAGRGRSELQSMVGYLTNPVVLKGELGGAPSVAELVARTRVRVLDAFEHQDYPCPLVIERLLTARDAGVAPVFQAMLVYQTAPGTERGLAAAALGEGGAAFELGELRARTLPLDLGTAQLDLSLLAAPTGDGLSAALEANRDLFDETTIRRMAGHLGRLLAGFAGSLATGGERAARWLPLLSAPERAQLAGEWQAFEPRRPAPEATLHRLFQRRAERVPEAIAVVRGERRLSYRELARRGAGLARRLRGLGVGPEVPVAICAARRPELVAGLLAVLAAGGAYVPLDPAYPRERLAWMLEDALGGLAAPVLLTERRLVDRLPRPLPNSETRRIFLDDLPSVDPAVGDTALDDPRAGDEHLAYLIYTSGSTGRPKGVAIEHRGAVALVTWAAESFRPRELAAVLASTSICFDLSVFELFVPLAQGGTVVLAQSVLELPRLPAAAGLSLINTVPSAMAELLRRGGPPASVRTVNLAGEPLSGKLVRRLGETSKVERVLNLYGPSEDTTYSTCSPARIGAGREPTLGRPIAGGHARVVRPDRLGAEPEPVGVRGELWLGGAGLARGYWRRPALTAERFVPDPFAPASGPGGRLYRTGDLARRLANGDLDYLGRLDRQVKLRGYRVELGEIEAALGRHPAVAEAAVMARPDAPAGGGGGPPARLAAYVAPEPGRTPAAAELRAFLAEELPAYMVPASFELSAVLPRTASGKLDRRALQSSPPAPRGALHDPPAGPAATTARRPPAACWSPLEELLALFYSEVLGGGQIGLHDDFSTLGGHSLLAARLVARIEEVVGVDLPPSAVFEAPTVAALAARIEARARESAPALPPFEPRTAGVAPLDPRPLSFAQERIYFFERLEPGTSVYHLAAVVRLEGRLDPAALARALGALLARHAALRTAIGEGEDGEPRQRVAPAVRLELPVIDLRRLGAGRRAVAGALARAEARRPFDLGRAPLVRARRLRLAARESLLALTLHHAIADGASLEIVLRELVACYAAFAEGRRPRLDPLPASHVDIAVWQRSWLGSPALEAQLDYWQRHLAEARPAEARPAPALLAEELRPTGPFGSRRGGLRRRHLGNATAELLAEGCRRRHATLFMGFAALFGALLGRGTGCRELTLGTPVAGRGRSATEGVVGCFVNLLALRLDLDGRPTFERLLAHARARTLAAFRHGDAPFELVVERLRASSQAGSLPVFRVLLSLQDAPADLEGAGVVFEPAEIELGVAKFDLTLVAERRADGLALAAEYRAGLFEATAIDRLLGHFETLLAAACGAPSAPLGELPILASGERHQLLVEWNGGPSPRPPAAVHRCIARRAQRCPDRVAAVAGGGALTYGALSAAAGRLAHELGGHGAGAGSVVGLCLDRGLETAVGLLGALGAGAAYLPLPPDTPRERLAFMVRDARPAVLVSRRGLRPVAAALAAEAGCPLVVADALRAGRAGGAGPAGEPLPEALAYVIYTSGSSGRPKRVALSHRALGHLAEAAAGAYALGPADRVLQIASLGFDLAAEELFPTWLAGGTAVFWDEDQSLEPKAFLDWARRRRLTLMNLSASYWRELTVALESGEAVPESLRLLITGNEPAPVASLERWQRAVAGRVDWKNAYGMTEAAVTSTVGGAAPAGAGAADVPVGRPLGAARVYLVDGAGQPLPIGVRGEVSVAGPGLARGYPGRARRTAGAFVPDPFAGRAGERLYRSGDLGRLRGDGTLELLGRADRQVKIRGFRVELAEVEAALAGHPGLTEAAVVVDGAPPDHRLVAFVAASVPGGVGEPRRFLGRVLPEPMVPAAFTELPALPRTPAGKIDRRALTALAASAAAAAETAGVAPRGALEERVAEIFRELLGRERVGRDDDFFALGGHSLLAIRAVARLRRDWGLEVPLARLFAAPTVAGLAAAVAGSRPEEAVGPSKAADSGGHPAAFSQERLFFLDRLGAGSPFYNLAGAFRLLGRLDAGALEAALREVVRRHDALRTVLAFEGGEVVQVVAPPAPRCAPPELSAAGALPRVDLGALPAAARQARALALAHGAARRPFDLGRGPLLRALLLGLGPEEHLLAVAMHHAISDARSLELFADELAALYRSLTEGDAGPVPPDPPLQYADYAVWQRRQLTGEFLAKLVSYWRRRLDGAPTVLELPADRPRPAMPSFRGAALPWALAEPSTSALAELGRRQAATLFMTLLAAFELTISGLTGRRDFLLGTDVANRGHAETEGAMGFFVNSLVLRSEIDGGGSFRELLERVRCSTLDAFAHQELPFHKLVEVLRPERAANRNPLFQVMLVLQSAAAPRPRLGELRLEPVALEEGFSVFDLSVSLERTAAGGLSGSFRYSTEIFEAATVEGWMEDWTRLLRRVIERPDDPIESFDLGAGAAAARRLAAGRERRRRQLERLGRIEPRAVEIEGDGACVPGIPSGKEAV